MTKKEKFISTFGQESFDRIMDNAKRNNGVGFSVIDLLEWFLEDYKEPAHAGKYQIAKPVVEEQAKKETIVIGREEMEKASKEIGKKKHSYTKIIGAGYDLKWYVTLIEDFYLSKDMSKDVYLKDDKSSGKKCDTLDGMVYRFKTAMKVLGIDRKELAIHKYGAATSNPYLCIEKPAEYINRFSVK